MLFVIDRIEGSYAVCENKNTRNLFHFPITAFPEKVKDGDTFEIKDNRIQIVHDEKNHEEIKEKMNILWE